MFCDIDDGIIKAVLEANGDLLIHLPNQYSINNANL